LFTYYSFDLDHTNDQLGMSTDGWASVLLSGKPLQ